MRCRIEPQTADLARRDGASAPNQRAQPRDELDEGERLGQVVVPSCGEAGQAVGESVPRGQEEHRVL